MSKAIQILQRVKANRIRQFVREVSKKDTMFQSPYFETLLVEHLMHTIRGYDFDNNVLDKAYQDFISIDDDNEITLIEV